ncbi:MAG: hypothetical protein DMF80_01975 [Acidobacteria bacterium]|nr:MAG: hypothetical protein DMF80_01975 [Acidobacteriota bacterium]PYQ18193.1 MAG: hypothetical protein DMF81_25645 [Acidobacteriota bacterium]
MALAAASASPDPHVVLRRRLELADPAIPGSKQPYHEAEDRKPKEAARIVGRCIDSSRALAREALGGALDELRARQHDVAGCGLLLSSGRPLPADLHAILASHALIHAAEGEMFRDVLVRAGEQFSLPVTGVRERDVLARAAEATGLTTAALQRRVAEMGRALGPPWRQDEKLATLAAWVVLSRA